MSGDFLYVTYTTKYPLGGQDSQAIQTIPHPKLRDLNSILYSVDSHTFTCYTIKAEHNDASVTFHKNEQTETSDLLVNTGDPLINRLRQHVLYSTIAALFDTEWKQQQQHQQQNKAFNAFYRQSQIRTNPHFLLYVPSPYGPSQKTNSSADSSPSRISGDQRFSFLR
jgi:LytS/YehU family sensor histidine kinase